MIQLNYDYKNKSKIMFSEDDYLDLLFVAKYQQKDKEKYINNPYNLKPLSTPKKTPVFINTISLFLCHTLTKNFNISAIMLVATYNFDIQVKDFKKHSQLKNYPLCPFKDIVSEPIIRSIKIDFRDRKKMVVLTNPKSKWGQEKETNVKLIENWDKDYDFMIPVMDIVQYLDENDNTIILWRQDVK